MKRALVVCLAVPLVSASPQQASKLEQAVSRAEQQLRAGRTTDALRTLGKAAESAGAGGQLALARLHERLGDLDAAAAAYERAVELAPGGAACAEARAAGVHFRLRRGSAGEALALAQQAVACERTSPALAALARAQLASGPESAAAIPLATAEEAVAADPVNGVAELARGEALLALERGADAESALRRAVALLPASALAQSRLALALLQLKRPAEALAAARHAGELDERHGEAAATLALALVAVDASGNWADAIAHAQTGATTLDPGNPLVHFAVGRVFEAGSRFENAVDAYRRALRLRPESVSIRLALLEARLRTPAREEALAAVRAELAAGRPLPPRALRLAGEDALRRGAWAEAEPCLAAAAREQPADPELWALLARARYSLSRYADTADALRRALAPAPQNAEYRSTYGLVLGQLGEFEAAEQELLAVTRTPGYGQAAGFANLGWVYRSQGKAAESIAAYRKALDLDPGQAQAALGLGWAYSSGRSWDEALAAYELALRIAPASAGLASSGIAWVHAQRRDPRQARAALERAKGAGVHDRRLEEWVARLEQLEAGGRLPTLEQMEQLARERAEDEQRQRALDRANARLQHRDPGARAAAARALAAIAGADAVDALIYAMQLDPDYGVRIAATHALAGLGAGARKAIPHMEGILRQDPYEAPIPATEEQLRRQMEDGDYRKALGAALERIRGSARVTRRQRFS